MNTAALVTFMAIAQQLAPAEFEVASVRLIPLSQTSVPGAVRQSIEAHPGGLIMRNVRMWGLVKWANDLKEYQISGVERLAAEHYNVEAMAEGAPVPQLRVMLQNLLTSRFKLTAHRETKEARGYELVVAKGGAQLRNSHLETASDIEMKGTAVLLRKTSLTEFADWLSGPMRAPVIDKTAIEGQFDLSIDVAPYQSPNATQEEQQYAFVTAMEKQLGLKLQSTKISVEYFIVDHADKLPAEN